jgi:hypothetical protein
LHAGARDPAVKQSTIDTTICVTGYSATVRPPSRITRTEKIASMAAYGDSAASSHYEYDHLVSLELGGAPNDPRNLWPEPGKIPNPKDRVENRLHRDVCDHKITLIAAQREIAKHWVTTYHQLFTRLSDEARGRALVSPSRSQRVACPRRRDHQGV